MNWNQSYNNWNAQEWQGSRGREQYPNREPQYYGSNDRFFDQGYPPQEHQNFEGEYFEEDPRYSHPARFRSDLDFDRSQDRWGQDHSRRQNARGAQTRTETRTSNADTLYGASRNFGSMGSYGGSQGFGSSRNGYSSDPWGSGHHGAAFQPRHTVYGAYRDKNSFAPGETASYDGSQRYGSQGAVSSRDQRYSMQTSGPGMGWGYRQRESSRRTFGPDGDSRYEIYDTAESQYNRGEYGNPSRGTETHDLNLHTHQNAAPGSNYGSRQRSTYRQGSGNDQYFDGTEDLGYGNTAGDLNGSYGHSTLSRNQNPYYMERPGDDWSYNSDRY